MQVIVIHDNNIPKAKAKVQFSHSEETTTHRTVSLSTPPPTQLLLVLKAGYVTSQSSQS